MLSVIQSQTPNFWPLWCINKSFSPLRGRSSLRFSSKIFPYSEYILSENTDEDGVQYNLRASSHNSGKFIAFPCTIQEDETFGGAVATS